jgi:signal transduction histidine kinase
MGAREVIPLPQEVSANGNSPLLVDPADLHQRHQDAAILSSRLAHSFDNVLTGILGFAELSSQMVASGSAVAEYLAEVLRAAQQGVVLTQQLHQFGRAAAAGEGPANLAVVVADEEARLRPALPPSLRLEVAVPKDLGPLAIGMEPLRQLLVHLLDNAVEATSSGTITVSARPAPDAPESTALPMPPGPGPFVEIVVADTGAGLTPETSRRLASEPFFTTKARHAGLGLATVSRILHAHGGGCQLSSVPGCGTRVCLYLPLATSSAAQTAAPLSSVVSR